MVKSRYTQGYDIRDDPKPQVLANELKYIDTVIAPATISSAGSWTKISLPPQGVTSVTRVADRARIVKLEHQFYSVITGGGSDVVRYILIQTKGLFTAAPSTTDLLVSASPISPYTYNARDLYEVLYDSARAQSLQGDSLILEKRVGHAIKEHEMKFIPGSTNVYSGQLYFLAITINNANVTHSHQFRLWFEDS